MVEIEVRERGFGILLTSLFLFTFLVLVFPIFVAGYPSILLSSLVIIGTGIVIITDSGMISAPSLFWALVAYPGLIPFMSDYLFHTPEYTLRTAAFESTFLVSHAVFLVAVFSLLFAAIVKAKPVIRRSTSGSPSFSGAYQFPYSKPGFVLVSTIVLVSAYLTTPGPTILQVDYLTIRQNYYQWATFAGSLYMGGWVVLFLMYRQNSDDLKLTVTFTTVTAVSLLWLLLHARRNESLGILLVVAVSYGEHLRVKDILLSFKKTLLAGILSLSVVSMIAVGKTRNGGSLFEGGLRELFVMKVRANEFVHAPGGAHNIFATYLYSIRRFTNGGVEFGQTFIHYPIQAIPTPILKFIPISAPPIYNRSLEINWNLYPGGNFILNEYILNFGIIGLLVAAIILAKIALIVDANLRGEPDPTLWTAITAAIIVPATRCFWYHQINWVNTVLAVVLTYVLFVVVTNASCALSRYDRVSRST